MSAARVFMFVILSKSEILRSDSAPAQIAHVAEFGHPVPAYLVIVCRLSEIAGKDDKIRLLIKAIDRSHSFLQRPLGVRIDIRSAEAPMRVGELNKIE